MTLLPEKIRKTLEKLVNEMRLKEEVHGISLFGSWSRGDASASNDIDLLIFDKTDFDYEYVERVEANGFLVDLDHVPKMWILEAIPTELDQKLWEMQILYDRDWALNNTKLLMSKSYGSPDRVNIRTEAHVIESDIYLSRASSAFSRDDFKSAYLFSVVALENILKVLIEVALETFSNSRFLENLESSASKLEKKSLFDEYSEIAYLSKIDDTVAKEKLKLFKGIWEEIKATVRKHMQAFESSHFKVRAKLNYYLNPFFLQGVVMRTNSLIDSGKAVEASHYLTSIFLDIAENYAWFKSSVDGIRADYATLARSLKSLEGNNPKNYACMVDFLGLDDVDKHSANNAIERTRKVIIRVRKERKALIKNHLTKS